MAANHVLHLAYPFFTFLILCELYFYRKRKQVFPHFESFLSLVIALSYQLINYKVLELLTPLNEWLHAHRLFELPDEALSSWVLGFFALDFAYYWQHRSGHRIRWMWASHSVHHSPPQLTFSGAYRLGITGFLSGLFVFFLPLMWLGFSPRMIGILYALNLIYQFWLHTELVPKLGWFEKVFNTPSHHRVHHAINYGYVDKNFGGILIIFDKIFGTYAVEGEEEKLRYGLIAKTPTYHIGRILFQEWTAIARDVAQATSLRAAFMYMFGPPGWQETRADAAEKALGPGDSSASASSRSSSNSQRAG